MADSHLDKLNNLTKGVSQYTPSQKDPKSKKWHSVDYALYFGEMGLDDISINTRIEIAGDIDDAVAYILAMMKEQTLTEPVLINTLYGEMLDAVVLGEYGEVDDYAEKILYKYATDIVQTTNRHSMEEYYYSDERSKFIAADVSNSLANYFDYHNQVSKATYKTWHTMEDRAVRENHEVLDGKRILVDDLFRVGDSYMRFPKDFEYGASDEEIINCRCWLTFE